MSVRGWGGHRGRRERKESTSSPLPHSTFLLRTSLTSLRGDNVPSHPGSRQPLSSGRWLLLSLCHPPMGHTMLVYLVLGGSTHGGSLASSVIASSHKRRKEILRLAHFVKSACFQPSTPRRGEVLISTHFGQPQCLSRHPLT